MVRPMVTHGYILHLFAIIIVCFYCNAHDFITNNEEENKHLSIDGEDDNEEEEIQYKQLESLIRSGKLSEARQLANQKVAALGDTAFAEAYVRYSAAFFEREDYLEVLVQQTLGSSFSSIFNSSFDSFFGNSFDSSFDSSFGNSFGNSFGDSFGNSLGNSLSSCWQQEKFGVVERWYRCCSYVQVGGGLGGLDGLCEVQGEQHLILPALAEPLLRVRLHSNSTSNTDSTDSAASTDSTSRTSTLLLEQEGFLRKYAVSGVLWPAGYLLGNCLFDLLRCGIPRLAASLRSLLFQPSPSSSSSPLPPRILELGAGTGFPSLALAKSLQLQYPSQRPSHPLILATDVSKHSHSLILSNARINNLLPYISVTSLNHTHHASIHNLLQSIFHNNHNNPGFDLIIGSSLQQLFHKTSSYPSQSKTNLTNTTNHDNPNNDMHALWYTLDTLLSKTNPNAMVLLSHVRNQDERIDILQPQTTSPSSSSSSSTTLPLFECLDRISGDVFNMTTIHGETSDFELVLLRRTQFSSNPK